MQENFRQFLDRLRQGGELVDLHQPVDIRHIATLVDQAKTALFFHKVIGYDVPVVSGIIRTRERATRGMGCDTYQEIEEKLKAAIDRPIPPRHVKTSPTREITLTGDEVDLYRLPIPMAEISRGGPMTTAGAVITRDPELGMNSGIYRFIVKEKNLTGIDIVTPNNMRLVAPRAFERPEPLAHSISAGAPRPARAPPDRDLDRYPSDRDHRLGLSRAARGRRDGDRGRHARRAGRARALQDHRPALYRGRRDRAGRRDPPRRLDLARGPLRRVHPPDGRAALESAGAHQGDLDAQGRDLLQPPYAVGKHLAGGADALCSDPPGPEDGRHTGEED